LRIAPLAEAGRDEIATVSIRSRSDLFFPYQLDRANHVEMAREFGFYAHADSFCVGWVERNDTHRVTTHAKQVDGFRKRSTHPTGYRSRGRAD
jgi:hypothetical protein